MKPEIKARWIKALLSGDYEQTKFRLKSKDSPNSYCCMGVLCDLYMQERGKEWKLKPDSATKAGHGAAYFCEEQYMEIPEEVLSWAGLTEEEMVVEIFIGSDDEPPHLATLIELNDDHNYTFEDIAKVIKDEL